MIKLNNFQIIDVFKNEYIIKLNQYDRNQVKLNRKNAYFSILINQKFSPILECLHLIKFRLSSFLSILFLLFTKSSPRKHKEIYLFKDKRNLKFNTFNAVNLKIGLFNIRYINFKHYYSLLSKKILINVLLYSLTNYNKFKIEINNYCDEINIDPFIYRKILNLYYFRYLDILLLQSTIDKKTTIYYCGHFDPYCLALSNLCKINEIKKFVGIQHGLIEESRVSIPYKKIYTNEYLYLYKDSVLFLKSRFLANCQSMLKLNKIFFGKNNISEIITTPSSEKIIAIAIQNDCLELDLKIIEKIKSLSDPKTKLICYIHPSMKKKTINYIKKQLEPLSICIAISTRYKNIDLLITRYSTLAMDYIQYTNTEIAFIPMGDKVCIFSSNSIKPHIYDFYNSKRLEKIL